jgi:hypothetical protein
VCAVLPNPYSGDKPLRVRWRRPSRAVGCWKREAWDAFGVADAEQVGVGRGRWLSGCACGLGRGARGGATRSGWCDAGQMVFNMNVGGGQSIFAQSSSRVNELDAELRDKHTGKPAEDIKPLALLALRRIGVSLSDAELVAYADAVSRGEKFQFHFS